VAWSLALKDIVSWAALTKVAVCPVPLYVTVELLRKFVPLIVSVWAAAPAVAEEGERLVIAGAGLLTVKFTEFDAPPPGDGFITTTA
jgi:hypothetical protein